MNGERTVVFQRNFQVSLLENDIREVDVPLT